VINDGGYGRCRGNERVGRATHRGFARGQGKPVKRWSPRILAAVVVLACGAAFVGWAAADPTSYTTPPANTATLPAPAESTAETPIGATSSPSATGTRTPAGPARTRTPSADATPPVPDQSLFDRAGPPPDGVPGQLEVFIGGGGQCAEIIERPGPPEIIVDDIAQQLPALVKVCPLNFDPAGSLRVTVTPPTGPARVSVLPPTGHIWFDASFVLRPSGPVGVYRLTAEQGDLVAETEVVAGPPLEPRLWRDPRAKPVTAGDSVEFFLSGFPAGRPATLHLYRFEDGTGPATYRTSFTVPIDGRGIAEMALATPHTLPDRCFILATDAVRTSGRAVTGTAFAFCVTAR
jgi:hypothetical protein